jgi:hypothetical protein
MAGAKHRHMKLLDDPKVKEWYAVTAFKTIVAVPEDVALL